MLFKNTLNWKFKLRQSFDIFVFIFGYYFSFYNVSLKILNSFSTDSIWLNTGFNSYNYNKEKLSSKCNFLFLAINLIFSNFPFV